MAVKTKTEAPERQILYPVLQNGRIGYMSNVGKVVVRDSSRVRRPASFVLSESSEFTACAKGWPLYKLVRNGDISTTLERSRSIRNLTMPGLSTRASRR